MSESTDAIESLTQWANAKIHDWVELMDQRNYQEAAEIIVSAIKHHGQQPSIYAPATLQQFHFGIRVVFNGLRDIANIKRIIAESRWIESPKAVETVWSLSHDAKDRLSGYSGLDVEFLEYCLGGLADVFDLIHQQYGDGIYTSTETQFDYLRCSICDSDSRGCEHIPGEWYGGQQCALHPEGLHPMAVAIVKNPHDPRCRIWPWLKRRDEGEHVVIENIAILISFKPEGEEDGGEVVNLQNLFAPHP